MEDTLYELLKNATVKLKVSDQSRGIEYGTGFIVAPDLILTCAHVVNLSEKQSIEVLCQDYLDPLKAGIHDIKSDKNIDIALLKFELPENLSLPCVLLDTSIVSGDTLYTFGYGVNRADQYFLEGFPTTFDCEGLTGNNPPFIKFKGGQVVGGMSGGAILNERTGKVCGIVRFTRASDFHLGGGGIQMSTVLSHFNEIEKLQSDFHLDNKCWVENLPKHKLPPSNIVYSSKIKFVGRSNELNSIYKLFKNNPQEAIVVIQGMGGVGKTELSRQYALHHKELNSYPGGIILLQARRREIGTQILNFVEDKFGLKPPQDRILEEQVAFCWSRWTEHAEGDVLVILDDVYDYSQIKAYLPHQDAQFKILITTRLRLEFQQITLDVLKEEAAIELLQYFIGREKEDSKNLCEHLGYLPLGLQLVGQYMKKRPNISVNEMLSRLEKKGLKHNSLLGDKTNSDWTITAERGVRAAFNLDWEILTEKAKSLGCLLSLFALAPIPWSIVEKTGIEEFDDLEDARIELEGWHLLQGGITFQFHQLIQEFFQEQLEFSLEKNFLIDLYTAAIVDITKQISDTLQPDAFQSVILAKPHIEKLVITQPHFIQNDYLYWPYIGLARFYNCQGAYKQVEYWCSKGLLTGENYFGATQPKNVTQIAANLLLMNAKVLRIQSEYTKALKCYKKALNFIKGSNNTLKVRCLRGQAHVYRLLGKYDSSIDNYEKSRELAEQISDSIDEARAAYGVARIYRLMGNLKGAEKRYQEANRVYSALKLPIEQAWALFGLAEVQRMRWNIKQSAKTYAAALNLYKQEGGHTEGEAYAKWGMGEINRFLAEDKAKNNQIKKAKDYFSKSKEDYQHSLELCKENNDTRSEAWALLGLAEVLRMEGNCINFSPDNAITKYQAALKQYQQAKDIVKEPVEEAHALLGIAATKRLLVFSKITNIKYKTIEKALMTSLKTYDKRKMSYCKVHTLIELSLYCLFHFKQEHNKMHYYLNQADKICLDNEYEKELILIEEIKTNLDYSVLHTLNFP